MSVDWVTVGAQIINFLVLVYLLKRLLYAPVLATIARREENTQAVRDAARIQQERADEAAQQLAAERQTLETDRDGILAAAKAQADTQSSAWLEAARLDVEQCKQQWERDLIRLQTETMERLADVVTRRVFDIARQALHELASSDLESQLVRTFVHHLRALSDDELALIGESATAGGLTIESAFPLSDDAREDLTSALKTVVGPSVVVRMEVNPERRCGLALSGAERLWIWDIDHYLQGLREEFDRLLTETRDTG